MAPSWVVRLAVANLTPSLCPKAPASTRRVLLHPSGPPIFVAAIQGVSLDLLVLKARGAYVCGSPRAVNNEERVLKQLPPLGAVRGDLSPCEGRPVTKH